MELVDSIMPHSETLPHYEELKGKSPTECETIKQCTELFKLYEKAIEKHKNSVLFYTCQQGHLLKILKCKERKNYQTVIKEKLKISMSTAKLRIRMFELVDKYQSLLYSNLSLNCFNKNHKAINEICSDSGDEFK